MARIDDDRAFPAPPSNGAQLGMTLRDWFAGQAMNGMLSNRTFSREADKMLASASYEIAAAMLAERAKGSGTGQ